MNWLAHLLLSDPTPACRIGNLLPDFLRGQALLSLPTLPAAYQRGIALHLEIDRFTDAHPIFRRSLARYNPPWRRYGGILTDIFYDHFLAAQWEQYSETPLDDFIDEVHTAIDLCRAEIPPVAFARLDQLRRDDRLRSYRHIDGIRTTLERMDQRLRKPVGLESSIAELHLHYEGLRADFEEFFPLLSAHLIDAAPRSEHDDRLR